MPLFIMPMSLFVLLHNVANEHARGGKHGAMVETAELVYRDKLVAHALEHRLEVEVLFIARHLFQVAVASDKGEICVQLAGIVQWCHLVNNG